MRPKPPSQPKQSVKLPQIGNKTTGNMSIQKYRQERPNSSKSIQSELERKLFTQLQTYDQKKPGRRPSSKIKKQLSSSCRQINTALSESTGTDGKKPQGKPMEKIAQMMPHLYTKILQTTKVQGLQEPSVVSVQPFPLPLKQANSTILTTINNTSSSSSSIMSLVESINIDAHKLTSSGENKDSSNNNDNVRQQSSSLMLKKGKVKSKEFSTTKVTSTSRINSAKGASTSASNNKTRVVRESSISKPQTNSFSVAEKQVNRIYEQYLKDEGLDEGQGIGQTSISELKQMNQGLDQCGVDIQELQRNYSNLIEQLGDLCCTDDLLE